MTNSKAAASTWRCTVLYFAAARETAGCSEETVALTPLGLEVFSSKNEATNTTEATATTEATIAVQQVTVDDIIEALKRRHPNLPKVLESCAFALDNEYVNDTSTELVPAGSTLVVIPPVSGG
ncbi:hypothetical protein GQ42DRAFT_161436 [Ramicandelaber brevisporus]|nr:hypothetical protein GQ42DRAFT_161436 [Ramicandelaber brevisporus]